MKLFDAFSMVATFLMSSAIAAPADKPLAIATSNPLESFPKLGGYDGRAGMASVDPDGVYRAYLADGTVVDAARLTSAQIETWMDVRAPLLSTAEAEAERALYSGIDLDAVTDEQLLAPSEANQPKAQLEQLAQFQKYRRDLSPLLEKRQHPTPCPSYYCYGQPYVCPGDDCICNTVICVVPEKEKKKKKKGGNG